MAADEKQQESIAKAISGISESLTSLVHDEIELAKAEVAQKVISLMTGAIAIAAGAVFGVFAVIFFLLTLAWVLDGIFVSGTGSLWLGFLIVFALLLVMTGSAFLLAWKKLRVGAPTPKMAISEAKKIRETVSASASKAPASIGPAAGNGTISSGTTGTRTGG